MHRIVFAGALVLVITCVAVGCGDKDKKPKTPICKSDKDCPGARCANGKCVACVDDSHCQAGEACKAGKCVSNRRKCSKMSDCAAGDRCNRAGECVKAQCQKDADCKEPKECQNGVCVGPADLNAGASICKKSCDAGRIPFGFNAHTLLTDATEHLKNKLLPCIKKAPAKCMLRIVGRTDNRGTNEYNLALADRRARQIHTYLVRLGIRKDRMVVMPIGRLEANASSEPGYSKDREARFEWFESALPK